MEVRQDRRDRKSVQDNMTVLIDRWNVYKVQCGLVFVSLRLFVGKRLGNRKKTENECSPRCVVSKSNMKSHNTSHNKGKKKC